MKKSLVCSKVVVLIVLISFIFSMFGIQTVGAQEDYSPMKPSSSQFVRAEGNKFVLGDEDYYFMGTNVRELTLLPKDGSKTKEDIKNEVAQIASSGVKVVRYFSCIGENFEWLESVRNPDGTETKHLAKTNPENLDPIILDNGQLNERALQTLDYTISEIGKSGMKSIFVFVNFESYCDPMSFFVQKYVTGLSQEDMHKELFYTKKEAKDAYKKYVSAILNRRNTVTGVLYKNDPAIFAWELCNEPHTSDNYESSNKGSMVFWWLKEMAKFVKSIDKNHMVSSGEEGYRVDGPKDPAHEWVNNGLKGVDFKRNTLEIPDLDFATLHVYPDNWAVKYDERDWVFDNFVLDRMRIAQAANYGKGKPLVIEESGYHPSYGDRNQLLKELYDYANKLGVAGTMVWSFSSRWKNDIGYDFGPNHNGAQTVVEQAAYMNSLSGASRDLVTDNADLSSEIPEVSSSKIGPNFEISFGSGLGLGIGLGFDLASGKKPENLLGKDFSEQQPPEGDTQNPSGKDNSKSPSAAIILASLSALLAYNYKKKKDGASLENELKGTDAKV